MLLAHLLGEGRLLAAGKLYLNEVMASNTDTIEDETGDNDDWVEIFNAGVLPVDLAGWYLTDSKTRSAKWQIPRGNPEQTTVPARGFLLLWFDNEPNEGVTHVAMQLSRKGEYLALVRPDGLTIEHEVEFDRQVLDVSYGRLVEQEVERWVYFMTPTPKAINLDADIRHGLSKAPDFLLKEGFYEDSITLALSSERPAQIYYTLNGSDPDEANRILYSGPMVIDQTTAVRALAIEEGRLPSKIRTRSYFIRERSSLPVVSLVCDPYWLYDEDDGIIANFDDDWEVPAHIEYFASDKATESNFSAYHGLALSGNQAKKFPKKSFSLRFRGSWGKDEIKYPLWRDKPHITRFDGLTLRADMAASKVSGNPKAGERIKNELFVHFAREMEAPVDVQAYQPALLFLNGEYWGLYNLMERKGIDFIRENHGVDEIDMLTEVNHLVSHGDRHHYQGLLDFLETEDMSLPENYAWIEKRVDVLSLIDYWIFELYSGAHDIEVNIRYWRPRTPKGRWRWLSFDMDSWNAWDDESFEYYLGGEHEVELLPELFENERFLHLFANRLCDYLNTVMSESNVVRLVESITAAIEPEIKRERQRWNGEHRYEKRGSQKKWIIDRAAKRPIFLRKDFRTYFGIAGEDATVILDVRGKGKIRVNTIEPDNYPWSGIYLRGVPVVLEALPADGWEFQGWTGVNEGGDSENALLESYQLDGESRLVAIFEVKTQ